MARFGSFAGGFASGVGSGLKLGMELEEAEEQKKDRELARRRDELGLTVLQHQITNLERDREHSNARLALLREHTMEPIIGEDASGNLQPAGWRPRDFDVQQVARKLADLDIAYGKVDPVKMLEQARAFATAKKEGVDEAYAEFLRSRSPEAAARIFNSTGNLKVDPSSITVEKGNAFGKEYDIIVAKTPDGRTARFDPQAYGQARAMFEALEKQASYEQKERQIKNEERKAAAADIAARAASTKAEAYSQHLKSSQQNRPDPMLTNLNRDVLLTQHIDRLVRGRIPPSAKSPLGEEVPAPVRFYANEIINRAMQTLAEGGGRVPAHVAVSKAFDEYNTRATDLEARMKEAFVNLRKTNQATTLATDFTELMRRGASEQEIQHFATRAGISPEKTDEALRIARRRISSGQLSQRPQPGAGGSPGGLPRGWGVRVLPSGQSPNQPPPRDDLSLGLYRQ